MTDSTIHLRHSASTLYNARLGTTRYRNALSLTRLDVSSFYSIPDTHLAHKSYESNKYFAIEPSWWDDAATDNERLSRHPENLKSLWNINQVQDPQAAYEGLGSKLLTPGIAE